MDAEHLQRFMVEVQEQKDATVEEAQAIIDSLKHLSIFHRRGFNLEGFFKYLFADDNPPINAKRGVSFCFRLFRASSIVSITEFLLFGGV